MRYGTDWKIHVGFWVVLSYRVHRLRKYGPFYCRALWLLDLVLGIIRRALSDTTIPSSVPVGAGLYLPHPNGIFINAMVVLGSDVALFQQTTLGEWQGKAPVIGDGSSVFAGAKVFGGIKVGKHCKVGANVALNQDIPDGSSVSTGIPLVRYRQEPLVITP